MNRVSFLFNSFFIPLVGFSLYRSTGTLLWTMLGIGWYAYGLYKRSTYIGIKDHLAQGLVILIGFIPIAFIPVWIILLWKDKDAFNTYQEPIAITKNTLHYQEKPKQTPQRSGGISIMKNYQHIWIVLFLVSSLFMLFFFVPYSTHMPVSVAKNDSTGWNGTVHYSGYFNKPTIVPKRYRQYTDISYGRLAVQEIAIVIVCGCGYMLTASKIKK